jgi:hypothetical protein
MRSALFALLAAFVLSTPVPSRAQAPSAKPGASATPPKKDVKAEPAQAQFFVEVMVLYASNSKKGIDPRIPNMPELKRPPFSAYDSYELLTEPPPLATTGKTRVPLSKEDPKTLKLPNGRVLQVKLLEILPKQKDRESVRFSASINEPRGKDFLPLLEVKAGVEQPFIVAGQSYKTGMLALVMRVVK